MPGLIGSSWFGVGQVPRGRSSPSRVPGKVEVHRCAVPAAGPVPRPWAAVHVRVQPGRGTKCFRAAGHVVGRAGPGARGPSRPGARASGVTLRPGLTSLDPDTVRVGRPPGDREVQPRTCLRPFLIAGCRARVTRQSNPRPATSPPESPWFGSLGPVRCAGAVRPGIGPRGYWRASESAFFCRKLLGTLQVGSRASGVRRPSHSSGPHLSSRKFQSHPDVPPVRLIELAPSDVSRDVLAA